MGCWRSISVDDILPVDIVNNVLLPSLPKPVPKINETPTSLPSPTSESKAKSIKKSEKKAAKEPPKEIIQIWPFILSKALLTLASLTWNSQSEIVDFDIINCFTGWIPQTIDVKGVGRSFFYTMFMFNYCRPNN